MGKCFSKSNNKGAKPRSLRYHVRQFPYQSDDSYDNERNAEATGSQQESCCKDDIEKNTTLSPAGQDKRNKSYTLTRPSRIYNSNTEDRRDKASNDNRADNATSSQPNSSLNGDRTDDAISSQPDNSHNDDRTDEATSSQSDSSHNDDRTDEATSSQPDCSHNDDRIDEANSSQPDSSHNDDRTDEGTSPQPDSSHNDDRTNEATSSQPDCSHNDDRTDVATSSQPVSSHNDDRTDVATSSQPVSSHNDDRTDEGTSPQPDSSHNDDRTNEATSSQPDCSHNDNRIDEANSSQPDSSHNDDRTDEGTYSQPDSSHNDDRTNEATSSQPDCSHNDDRTDVATSSQPDSSHNDDRSDEATSSQPDSSHNDDRSDEATSSQPDSSHNDDRTDEATSPQPDNSHNDDRTNEATSSQPDSSHNDDRTNEATSSQPDSSHNDDRTDEATSSQPDSSHNDDRTDVATYSQPDSSHNDDRTDVATSSQPVSSHNDDRTDEATSSQPDSSLNDDRTDEATSSQPDSSHNDDRTDEATSPQPDRSQNEEIKDTVDSSKSESTHNDDRTAKSTSSPPDIPRTDEATFSQPDSCGKSLSEHKVLSDEEPDVSRLKQRLVEINNLEIPLTPLQEDSDKLPIEQLFASVIIKKDSNKSVQGGKEQELKEVKTPEDILTKNGKPVRRVYIFGDAAHGKTAYCTWLLKKWCNAQKPGVSCRPLNEWENALSQFDFVFHIKFRHVDPSRTNVIDMICQDILGESTILQTAAKHVLSSYKYRCLIIMDGLDEWKPDQLKGKGIPNIDNMSNGVIFITMRPWMFAAVAGLVRNDDRVIEIQGLDDKCIEDVIEKVLVHYYDMKPDSNEYKAKHKEIISKLKDKTLKSFIHIPLLAVVCIQIWCTEKQVGNSLTSFYSVMIDMLIDRAKVNIKIKTLEEKKITYSLPEILMENENITNHISILLKLGKVAYEGLLSNKGKLEFQIRKLEKDLGKEELQFALDVGLISQTEAPTITTRNVNVHFFHKSVQEFLAVIYIVTRKKVSDAFCTRLCNVKVIMELSNVIMFICGMCPSLGSVISQHVVSVTNSDGGICEYRELPMYNDTVVVLYKLQVSWYRELQYGKTDSQVSQTDNPVTDRPVTFQASDVYLSVDSDTETVRVTRELLSGPYDDMRSLCLWYVRTDGEHGITVTELDDFLSNTDKTRSLVKLYIYGGNTCRSVHTLCIPSLRTLCLWSVTIQDRDSVHRPLITNMDGLQRLWLNNVSLCDRGLGLTPHMTHLQEVVLYRVSMTQSGWGRLIQSVIDIHHQFVVTLNDVNIGSDSLSTLHSSPHICVEWDIVGDDDIDGGREINFKRVWPLTQDTQ